jgi:cyclophilin family peptidyl-prolyl cis-trans isomerase
VRDSLPFSNSAEARFPALLGLLRTQGLVSREAAAALVTLETPELWAPWAPDVRRELLRILDEAGASDEASIEAAVSLVAALGQQRSSDDRSHLLGLMTHEVSSLRAAAVRELSGPGHVEASGIRAVLWDRLLHDPSDGVGALAAEGLLRGLRIPQEVLVDAERLIEEASPSVAYRIGPLLGAVAARRGSEPVIRWTERMLTDHPVAAALGVNAVGGLSDPPLTAVLLSWARHPHPAVEGAAIRALHRRWERIYGGEEEMAQYVALFDEKIQTGGRMAATYALRGLGHPVFLPFGGRQVLEDALEHRVPDAWYGDLAFERDRMLVGLDAFEGRAPGAVPVEVDPEGGVPDRDPLEGTAVSASYLVLELESSALAFELFQGACCPAASMVTEWAVAGRFEGVPLHRVITGFLVQGGDGLAEDGTGGVLTSSVPLLGPAYPFQRGTLGLAVPLDDTPNGIQFFVSVASMPGLDGNYPAIGQLVSDPRVLESIRVGGRILRACLVRDVPVQLEARACESG